MKRDSMLLMLLVVLAALLAIQLTTGTYALADGKPPECYADPPEPWWTGQQCLNGGPCDYYPWNRTPPPGCYLCCCLDQGQWQCMWCCD